MKLNLSSLTLVACTVMMASLGRVSADTEAYSFAGGTENDLAGYGISGVEFTLNSNIHITQLGFSALSLGGADTPHVTLWEYNVGTSSFDQVYDTGNILGSVTNNGLFTNSATLSYVSVGAPIALTAGNIYLVTAPAYWANTYSALDINVPTVPDPLATVAFLKGGGWSGWDNSNYNVNTMTPALVTQIPGVSNFQFTVDPLAPPPVVPEPSTYAMLTGGLALLAIAVRRRKLNA